MRGTTTAAAPPVGDLLMTLFLLVVFLVGYVQSLEWPDRAALFPQMLSVAGLTFVVFKAIGFGVDTVRNGRLSAGSTAAEEAAEESEDGKADNASLEYAFSTAGRRAWLSAIGWAVAFFALLWLVGVFLTVPVFTFVYLRVAGQAGWLGSGIYAVASGGIIWLAFSGLLSVPMPNGIF